MTLYALDALLQEARRRAGYDGFGPEDFLPGLRALLVDLNQPGLIAPDRVEPLRERLLRLLVNRAWFARDLAQHPQIAEEVIARPVEIVSLARAGSTKLHRLLGASGDFQVLPMWKTHMFARIPGLPDGGEAERIRQVRDYEAWMLRASPDIRSGHPMFTEQAEEDQWLGECTFRKPMTSILFGAMNFAQWLMQNDPRPGYDYFHSQLQYLQWQNRQRHGAVEAAKPWLLKSPDHLGMEAQLAAVFPDMRFLITHRSPVECVPSGTAMTRHFRMLYAGSMQTESVGSAVFEFLAMSTRAHLAWRQANPRAPVLDLRFRQISDDGMAVAHQVYDFLGMPLNPSAAGAIAAWQQENERDKHGKNVYAVNADDAALRQLFGDYIGFYSAYI